jgi:GAF domain-containing protein
MATRIMQLSNPLLARSHGVFGTIFPAGSLSELRLGTTYKRGAHGYARSRTRREGISGRCVRGGAGACGIACLERRRVVVKDTERDECFAPFRHVATHEGFRAVHSTPLLSHAGEILGAISVHFATPRSPTAREIRLADICARKAAVYIERSKAEALAQERARYAAAHGRA